jgi:hypothetical protein
MKLHRIILLGILCITIVLSACTSNEPAPPTALRGAVVPTRVTETPTATEEATAEATLTQSPATNTPVSIPTEEATVDVIALVTEVTEEAVITEEPTEIVTVEVTATEEPTEIVTEEATATEEPTEEIVASNTPTPTETLEEPTHTPTATLRVASSNTPTPTSTPTVEVPPTEAIIGETTIAYGDVVGGTITNANYEFRYTFAAQAGDFVSIIMRATDRQENLDGYLTILAPNGAQLVVNDDLNSLESYDPGITNYEIPQSGIYTIIASRFNGIAGTSSGGFELSLEVVDGAVITPTPAATEDLTETAITYGGRAQGDISNDTPYVAYQFVAQEGDVIGIQVNMLSGTLDPQVVLFSANGAEIASNDDDPLGGFNAYLRDFVIPEGGVYTIWATRFNRDQGTSEGQFELLLEKAGGGVTPPPVTNTGVIVLDEVVSGEITNGDFARTYTFSGTQGQVVTFIMRANVGNLDPYLILVDPEGKQIARNDDGQDLGFNSSLDKVRLPMTGDYTVVASRFQVALGVTQGTFQLTATEDTGTSQALITVDEMGLGDSISDGLNGGAYHYYTFLAEAGDVVTILLANVSGNLDPFLSLEDSFGTELVRSYDDLFDEEDNVNNAIIRDFIIPNTGYYVIGAGYSGETTGQYRLILNRTETTSTIPQYAVLDWVQTSTFADGEPTNFLINAGDWVIEDVERRVGSVLTFRLPTFGGQIPTSAQLTLEACYLTNPSVFDLFGELEISNLSYYASDAILPLAFEPSPTVFTTVSKCQDVDMTDLVLEAYGAGATFLQIQINFASADVNVNNSIDAVIFVDPRLELYFDAS